MVVAAEALGRHATADTMILVLMLFALVASGDAQAALQPGGVVLRGLDHPDHAGLRWINLLAPSAVAQASSLKARLAGLAAPAARAAVPVAPLRGLSEAATSPARRSEDVGADDGAGANRDGTRCPAWKGRDRSGNAAAGSLSWG